MASARPAKLQAASSVLSDTPIGICIPVYNHVQNTNLSATVFTIEQCIDLPYELSLGIGPNCVAKNRLKALSRLSPEIRYVLMSDDDVLVSPHFASRMLATLQQGTSHGKVEGQIGAVSAAMMGMRGEPQNNLHPSNVPPGTTLDTLIPGTFFMYDRKATPIEWDTRYLGSQWEDTDGIMQIKQMGYRTVATGNVQIMHRNPMSGGGAQHWNKNKARFIEKWGKAALQ